MSVCPKAQILTCHETVQKLDKATELLNCQGRESLKSGGSCMGKVPKAMEGDSSEGTEDSEPWTG